MNSTVATPVPSGLGNHLHWGPQPKSAAQWWPQHHNEVLEHALAIHRHGGSGHASQNLQPLAEREQWLPIDPPWQAQRMGVVARGKRPTAPQGHGAQRSSDRHQPAAQ